MKRIIQWVIITLLALSLILNIILIQSMQRDILTLNNHVNGLLAKVEGLDEIDDSTMNVLKQMNENDEVLMSEINNIWCVLLGCK